MSIIIKMTGDKEFAQYIDKLPSAMKTAITFKMEWLATHLSDTIKQKLSGSVLRARTGKLRESIYARVYMGNTNVTLSFGSRGDVPYASIHEYGGVINHPGVMSRDKGFMLNNRSAYGPSVLLGYTKRAKPHNIPIPKRSYIKSTRDEMLPSINSKLREAIMEVTGGSI